MRLLHRGATASILGAWALAACTPATTTPDADAEGSTGTSTAATLETTAASTSASTSAGASTSPDPDSGSGSDGSGGPEEPEPLQCDAQCRYVTPEGRGAQDGSDWDHALAGLPEALERGAVYLLADGEYAAPVLDDPPQDGLTITIRKALELDHGTDAGWVAGDGDGQAAFPGMLIVGDDYELEGVRRNADWRTGGVDGYGITTGNVRLDDGNGTGADRVRLRHVDMHGGGRDTGDGDDVIYGLAGNTGITVENCAVRDSDRTLLLMRGQWQDLVVDHSYLARNTSTPAVHGEALSMTDSVDVTFSNNAIEDIEGTAVFAALNDGVATGWRVYGNTIVHTADYIDDVGRAPGHNFGVSGFVFCANDASNDNTCDDFQVHGNTFVRVQGLWSGVVIQQGTGNAATNNLWYECVRTGTSGVEVSSSWYFDTQADGDGSSDQEVCAGDCDVFVDLDGRDFRLALPTMPGTTLAPPFDVDPDGTARGGDGSWDRGAFER